MTFTETTYAVMSSKPLISIPAENQEEYLPFCAEVEREQATRPMPAPADTIFECLLRMTCGVNI
jgi:hypothetical protein